MDFDKDEKGAGNYYCSVPGCTSWKKRHPGLSFHAFPSPGGCKVWVKTESGNRHVDRRDAWIMLLGIRREVSKFMKVCGAHFTEDDFFNSPWARKKFLKKNAVPTRNLPPHRDPPVYTPKVKKVLKLQNVNSGGDEVESMPKKKMETRNQSKRAASKEAMKQMQLISSAYDDDDAETFEIPSDGEVKFAIEAPPKKKYKMSTRKSLDSGHDRGAAKGSSGEKVVEEEAAVVAKKLNVNATETLKLETWAEDLSPAQLAMHQKRTQELEEMNARIEQFAQQTGAEVIYQGETCSAYQVTSAPTSNITIANVQQQPNILVQKANNTQNSYQLVVDPRIGFIVGTMTPATPTQIQQPLQQKQTMATTPTTGLQGKQPQGRKRGRNSITPSVSLTPISSPSTPSLLKTKLSKPPMSAAPTKAGPTETNSIGGLSGTPQRTLPVPNNNVVDLTSDDNRPAADTREVSFNKLQGKTFPSLVVVARPHLRVKDVSGADRARLDAKVKSVLMHPPTKFTEWLIQQGLVRSEQTCRIHTSSKLKLGMYSDASKFPYSGGYVWISDCCPQRFVSVFSGSLFEGSPHPPTVILKLIYHWACQTNVQNVVQWVKVDNLYVKGLNTWLRAVCTVSLYNHIRPLGGPMRKVEVGVISLGTTSQDGHQRQVKVEVLGLLEVDNKLLRLRAVEPLADGDRNYKKRFSKILEPIVQWVHPDSLIVTDLTVDKSTLHGLGFKHVLQSGSTDSGPNNNTIMEYLRRIVPRMFQNTLSLLSRQIIQQFLDELVWREWYGTTAAQAFDNIITHLAEQTRADMGQSLIMRLNKISANPFKVWYVHPWGGNAAQPSNSSPTVASGSANKLNDVQNVKRPYGKQQRKLTLPKAPSPVPEVIRPPKAISPDIPEQMVPLENYYFGTIEGRFETDNNIVLKLKCCMCKATFSNNITLMTHLFFHAHNVPGTGVQQCRYCLASVTSAESLNKHITSSHPQITRVEDGFACVICEMRFQNPYSLGKHMSTEHCPSELPYQCGTCQYQCSSHKQAVDHFYKSHSGGASIQCPFCLKSLSVASHSRMLPQNMTYFLQHLQKHQKKALARKCGKCALWFINKEVLKEHQIKMHASNRNKPGLVPWTVPRNSIMVPKSKQDYRPMEEDSMDLSSLRIIALSKFVCKECKYLITTPGHFPSLESCSNNNCQYATCCKFALKQHDTLCRSLNASLPLQDLPFEMFCVCGFSSTDGNILAKHLAECERKSAYPSMEAATKAIVTHSMLDVLGLVRRPEEPQTSAVEIVELDKDDEKTSKDKSSGATAIDAQSVKTMLVERDDDGTVVLDDDSSEEKDEGETDQVENPGAPDKDKNLTESASMKSIDKAQSSDDVEMDELREGTNETETDNPLREEGAEKPENREQQPEKKDAPQSTPSVDVEEITSADENASNHSANAENESTAPIEEEEELHIPETSSVQSEDEPQILDAVSVHSEDEPPLIPDVIMSEPPEEPETSEEKNSNEKNEASENDAEKVANEVSDEAVESMDCSKNTVDDGTEKAAVDGAEADFEMANVGEAV